MSDKHTNEVIIQTDEGDIFKFSASRQYCKNLAMITLLNQSGIESILAGLLELRSPLHGIEKIIDCLYNDPEVLNKGVVK